MTTTARELSRPSNPTASSVQRLSVPKVEGCTITMRPMPIVRAIA
jgi:hypothetical protein